MQGNGGLHGVVSDTCEHRTDGMQGRSENVAHARAVDGLRLRRAPQSQLDLYAPSNPLFRSGQSEPLRDEVAQTRLPRRICGLIPALQELHGIHEDRKMQHFIFPPRLRWLFRAVHKTRETKSALACEVADR